MISTITITLHILLYHTGGDIIPFCEYATANKYIGYYDTVHGSTNVKPYFNYIVQYPQECKIKCQLEDKCYVASLSLSNLCSFYNISNLHIDKDMLLTFYIWRECDWSSSVQPLDSRCPGMFIRYMDNIIQVTNVFLILKVIDGSTLAICLSECSLHPLCKAINYKESLSMCSLHQLWPHNEEYQEPKNETDLFKWRCIPHFVENLKLPGEPRQPNTLKCTGYWEIKSRNSTIPNIYNPGVYFFTQSYKTCLQECTLNPECFKALFNVTNSVCVLPFIEASDRNKYLETLTYIIFEWICLKNDSIYPTINEKEREYVKVGLECVTLINNSEIYITQDNCGHFPQLKEFVTCHPDINKRDWDVSDSCLLNQSFWKSKTVYRSLNISESVTNYATRIFTGLTSFWMVHSEKEIFRNTSFLECRRFNGAKGNTPISSNDIITRDQWYAYRSQGSIPKYAAKPIYLVLSASQEPYFGCRTIESCTSLLRNLQLYYFRGSGKTEIYSDIPYNFMLDESGNIYQGRGWQNSCKAVGMINYLSLCFGFIGRFVNIKPSLKFLQSIKRLIIYAVENGFLKEDYILYIHQDATKHKISRNYEIIIKEWYRYRGFVPKNCFIIKIPIVIISGIFIIVTSSLLFIIYKSHKSRKNCKMCNFLHFAKFKQIYPKLISLNEDYLEHIVGYDSNTTQCIVREKGSPMDQRKFIKFLTAWFLNKSMKTLNSNFLNYDLGDYLNHFQSYKHKLKIYEAQSSNYRGGVEDNVRIVVCFTNTKSQKIFEGLTWNKLCVCQHFYVSFVSFPEVKFKTI